MALRVPTMVSVLCVLLDNPWKSECACVSRRGNGIMASWIRCRREMREATMFLLVLLMLMLSSLEAVKVSPLIEKVSDHKDFKKLLRTRTNVLVLYTKTG
ncbi:hypothetical protein GOODEAATRI_007222 [Goodea atripinnis]|uniref:Uncharacterized protein n=1 Tax=Goodea atripinnis TaxID=208336 RepID=A0ABV0MZM6_9TELE